MAPLKRDTKKMKATRTQSSAQRGVVKRTRRRVSSDNTDNGSVQDRISSLPNCILGSILALLSVGEATRMTVQSRTWKKVFSSPDYKIDSIDDNDLWRGRCRPCDSKCVNPIQSQWRSNAITALLDTRGRYIRRLVVQRTLPSDSMAAGWLDTLSGHGVVQDLVLEVQLGHAIVLPRSIFNCSSLQSLSLSNCRWPRIDNPGDVPEWTLPHLTELTLRYIAIGMSSEAVKDLLRRCPALLSLSLSPPQMDGELDIRCKNLLSLTIVGHWHYVVRIMDAPKLERLLWWPLAQPYFTLERTIQAPTPRLHTLGIFICCPDIKFGVAVEQVRTIALFTNVDNLDDLQQAILTLHKFPHLETIHMKMMNGSESNSTKNNKAINFEELAGGPIACLENSIKTIVLRVNNLVRQKLAFTNFLLGAAKSLKSMLIYKKRMAGELLPLESRGSSNAQIVFGDSNKCSLQFMDTSASNFKLADPFLV